MPSVMSCARCAVRCVLCAVSTDHARGNVSDTAIVARCRMIGAWCFCSVTFIRLSGATCIHGRGCLTDRYTARVQTGLFVHDARPGASCRSARQ
jgi:hypothetical protein